jgi:DNA-directed RNA polymerase subunit M/transcription elongation factor TFIIS
MNEEVEKDDPLHFVGIQFCQECNNMLYPREDKINKVLLFQCRNCQYKIQAERPCIYGKFSLKDFF